MAEIVGSRVHLIAGILFMGQSDKWLLTTSNRIMRSHSAQSPKGLWTDGYGRDESSVWPTSWQSRSVNTGSSIDRYCHPGIHSTTSSPYRSHAAKKSRVIGIMGGANAHYNHPVSGRSHPVPALSWKPHPQHMAKAW